MFTESDCSQHHPTAPSTLFSRPERDVQLLGDKKESSFPLAPGNEEPWLRMGPALPTTPFSTHSHGKGQSASRCSISHFFSPPQACPLLLGSKNPSLLSLERCERYRITCTPTWLLMSLAKTRISSHTTFI